MRYTLKDEGYPFKKIYTGRKWVGRVFKHADGHFVGKIGEHETMAANEIAAFNEVVAKACGFSSYHAMHFRNSQIRARNRAVKADARYVVNEMLRGNSAPLYERFLGITKEK